MKPIAIESDWKVADLRGVEQVCVPWRQIFAVAMIALAVWLCSQGA